MAKTPTLARRGAKSRVRGTVTPGAPKVPAQADAGGFVVALRPVTEVRPYARNPRKNAGAVAKVAESIRTFGFRQPIVVDSDGVIIAGHTRFLAALHLGLSEVPVHVAAGLKAEDVKAYRLADNRSAQESEWDSELLRLELSDLKGMDYNLALTAFDDKELRSLFRETGGREEPVPWLGAAPQNPVTVPGDLIVLGRHRLFCGDSTDPQCVRHLLQGLVPTMVCTDPPYGISIVRSASIGGAKPFGEPRRGQIGSGNIVPTRVYDAVEGDGDRETAVAAYRLAAELEVRTLIFWGANHYAAEAGLPSSGCWLVWDKENGTNNFADAELAWTNVDAAVRLFRHMWNGMLRDSERGPRFHPTQKPVALARWCYERFGHPGDSVLDLFAGAGWTVLAAEEMDRTCYAIEKSPAYCDVIASRWETLTGQTAERRAA